MSKSDPKIDTIVTHYFKPGDAEAMKRFCDFADALEEGMNANFGLRRLIGAMVLGGVIRLLRDQIIPSMERQGL
jgi:hypothetical protein